MIAFLATPGALSFSVVTDLGPGAKNASSMITGRLGSKQKGLLNKVMSKEIVGEVLVKIMMLHC